MLAAALLATHRASARVLPAARGAGVYLQDRREWQRCERTHVCVVPDVARELDCYFALALLESSFEWFDRTVQERTREGERGGASSAGQIREPLFV